MSEDECRPQQGPTIDPVGLRWFLRLFGAVCCVIALAHIALGPSAIPGSVAVNATMDSEDRFYATLFCGFGAAIIWCGAAPHARSKALTALLALFFLGGVSRIISAIAVGMPSDLFIVLTTIELALPPGILLWLRHLR